MPKSTKFRRAVFGRLLEIIRLRLRNILVLSDLIYLRFLFNLNKFYILFNTNI